MPVLLDPCFNAKNLTYFSDLKRNFIQPKRASKPSHVDDLLLRRDRRTGNGHPVSAGTCMIQKYIGLQRYAAPERSNTR